MSDKFLELCFDVGGQLKTRTYYKDIENEAKRIIEYFNVKSKFYTKYI
ncbi:MAG: hypothetical protein QW156_00080 [Candidatus Aenigmatarchaeota archaeon]